MKTLRKETIKLFLICVIGLSLANMISDGIFEIFLRMYPDASWQFNLIGVLNIGASLLYLFICVRYFLKRISQMFGREIQSQMDQQSLLYSSIAHDLKTPLTSIKGYSSALAEGRVADEDLLGIYQVVHQKSEEMSVLLSNLLDYTRFSQESYQPEMVEINLSQLVTETIASNYDAIEAGEIVLDLDIEDGLVISGAASELKRVFENLLVNAVHHNPLGTKVKVSLWKSETGEVRFFVADSGLAIDRGLRDSLFNPFYKLDSARTTGKGSGLGLAIVKMIVERYQGWVRIEDLEGDYTKAFVVGFGVRQADSMNS